MKRIQLTEEKSVEVNFAIKDIVKLSDGLSIDFAEAVNGAGLREMETMVKVMHVGLNSASLKTQDKKEYSLDEVWEMVDARPEVLGEVMNIYAQCVDAKMERVNMGFTAPATPMA